MSQIFAIINLGLYNELGQSRLFTRYIRYIMSELGILSFHDYNVDQNYINSISFIPGRKIKFAGDLLR